MGIYISGVIYGIRICDNNSISNNILFIRQYNMRINSEQKREAYNFYSKLETKEDITVQIYTECNDTYTKQEEEYMIWYPISIDLFLESFNV